MRKSSLWLVVTVAALASLTFGCYLEAGAASATETVEKTLPLTPAGSFRLENVNGSVTLAAWDRPEVHVKAVKKARGVTQEKAKEALAKTEVSIKAEGNEVTVETIHPKKVGFSFPGSSVTVQYEVSVPRGARVSLTTVNGALDADAPGSTLSCESVNGAVKVTSSGALKAESVNGKITFRASSVDSVETTNGSVEGMLDGPQVGEGSVSTVNGSVTLTLGANAALTLSAENVNGSVESTIPGIAAEKHRASGKLGAGGPTLSVETVNGSITLKGGEVRAAEKAP
jgi:DUF4097 and DUF4098 domain-containing protein YvlB